MYKYNKGYLIHHISIILYKSVLISYSCYDSLDFEWFSIDFKILLESPHLSNQIVVMCHFVAIILFLFYRNSNQTFNICPRIQPHIPSYSVLCKHWVIYRYAVGGRHTHTYVIFLSRGTYNFYDTYQTWFSYKWTLLVCSSPINLMRGRS